MKILLALLGYIILGDGKLLSIDKVEVDIDPIYMKVAPKLIAEGGINRVNLDIDVLKEENEIVYQAIVYRHNVDHYEHFYMSDMENDCNHAAIKDPVLSFIFKESKKFGNITEMCPLKIGHYSLRSFTIDTGDLPHELPAGEYRFDFTAYVKKNSQLHDIYTDKYYFAA